MRGWSSRHCFFCPCDSAVRFPDSEELSQSRLLPCMAPRRVHFARPWTQASKATLTDCSLTAKRCTGALPCVVSFNQASEPSSMSCCSVRTLVWFVPRKTRAGYAGLPCFLDPSPRRPTASCSLAAEAQRLRSRIVVVFVVQRIDCYSYFSVYLVLLLRQAGSAPGRLCTV